MFIINNFTKDIYHNLRIITTNRVNTHENTLNTVKLFIKPFKNVFQKRNNDSC